MPANQHNRLVKSRRIAQRQPDYSDEISEKQMEEIRRLADPDGKNAQRRTLLYPDAW